MDKAEKIKAARKKLKEFQSHKKHDEDVPGSINDSNTNEEEQVRENPIVAEVSQQQPATASFFDTIPSDASQFFQNIPSKTVEIHQPDFITQDVQQHLFNNIQTAPQVVPEPSRTVEILQPDFINQSVQQNLFNSIQTTPQVIPESISMPQVVPTPTNYFNNFQQQSVPNDDNKLKELQEQINQQSYQIAQLKSEVEFHRTTATNLQKNTEELTRLKQQEHQHGEAIKILVTEKSHLHDALVKSENIIATLKGETEELHNRLNLSRHRVKQLESMASSPQSPSSKAEVDPKMIEEIVSERIKSIQQSLQTSESEKSELKLILSQKKIEMENLQKNYDHLNNELHLQSIKIAQLSDGIQPDQPTNQTQIASFTQEIAIKQQQINELNSVLDQLNREKEASETQYQNYVSAMTREMDLLKENSIELSNENNSLVKREQELLKHVSDLERQIQQQIQKQKTYAENNQEVSQSSVGNDEEIQKLTSQIIALTAENETIKSQASRHDSEKLELAQQLELKTEEVNNLLFQMERLKTETPNVSQLMVDFEDKSTAASRALSQNQSLKEQLEELQRAFINISNDKMELTDKLQSELHLCKEMKIRHDAMETELTAMKDKWQYKEDEMIRLSHENTELEKKILQQNIEIDRLRHYESKDYHRGSEGVLDKELENCRHMIETLKNKIKVLEGGEVEIQHSDHSGHGHSHSHDGHGHSHSHEGHSHSHEGHSHSHEEHNHDHSHSKDDHDHNQSLKHESCNKNNNKHLLDEIEMLKMEKNELLKAINDFRMNKKSEEPEITVNGTDHPEEMTDEKLKQMTIPKSVTPSMATEEALEKLQERFRRTMLEVADLTEEKNRLEHLVTQLQFETETIGEYITLYQNQRRLLKQKEHERDIQIKNLAADRELMNKKLLQLNSLIEKFVLQHTDQVEVANEATKLIENEGLNKAEPMIISGVESNEDFEKLKKETAGKILEILSDIKTTNTHNYDSNIGVENCSCCMGRLETV